MSRVTVVIPAYNAERYIGEALASIREQTLREVEVLLIDDGSSDGTVREAERYADSLDLKIMRQSNAGPGAARNLGVHRASGRYCAFLDADDVMLPERLAAQVALLEARPELGLVHTDLMTFNEGGIIHRTRRAFSSPYAGMVLDRLLLDNFITTSTVVAPTERLLAAGLFSEQRRVSEDFDLWLRMAARWEVGYIDRPLVRYRRRRGSLSDDKLATWEAALEVVEAFWQRAADYGKANPEVRRRSLARHLCGAGAAALTQGRRGAALAYLLRALGREPGNVVCWKWLVKTLLVPGQVLTRRAAPGAAETA
jgi:glycosyltransferase involved in cell wall biosynthesis